MLKLPNKTTHTIYLTVGVSGWEQGRFFVTPYDPVERVYDDRVYLTKKEITFDVPQDIDLKGMVVEGLQKEMQKVKAEHHVKVTAIQDKIDSLLAIEHQGADDE